MKSLKTLFPNKNLEIAATFVTSATFTFFITLILISSSYTMLSDEEHLTLLDEINSSNIKASNQEWNSKHYKEKLELISLTLESTQAQLTESQRKVAKLNVESAELDSALNQLNAFISKCAEKRNTTNKLNCFAQTRKMASLVKNKNNKSYSSVEKKGYWSLTQHRTPTKEITSVFLTAKAQNITTDGDTAFQPTLNLHCDTERTNAYIDWGFDIKGIEVKLLTQLDKKASVKNTWSISKTGHHTIAPGDNQQFIKNLIAHKHFFAQIRDKKNQPILADFNLTDLGNIIEPLRVACAF
ncbi:MAG: hypothetical protein KUG82_09335 [Pseudomonadales bacterium]|nr:hypothetical protein [Pseudomonadales bacterium]